MTPSEEIGLASARYVDHLGMTVPDMDAAIHFFEQGLGAHLLWRVGPFHESPTAAHIDSVEIAMLRLGPSMNLELLAYTADAQRKTMPSNVDLGAGHIAFFVDDLQAAAESLRKHGAELLAGPLEGAGEAKKGERIWYWKTPWGAFMEILSRPEHMPYESTTDHRLFNPNDAWPDGIASARHVDHLGIVVPDLEEAVHFFQVALGAQHLWTLGPFFKTPTGVAINSVRLAMLRLGPNLNLELQQIDAVQQRRSIPSNIDWGAVHAGVFVDDLHAAAASLRIHGATLLEGPINTAGDAKSGEQIWYFNTPWGALLELLWRPSHLPYEASTKFRLFRSEEQWPIGRH